MLQEEVSWRGIFRDLSREHGFVPLRVEGRLPPELRGALYRCGPALFGVGGESYRHWFDGDGAVTSVRFEGGRAEGAVRLVDTPWLRAERRANRQLYRSYAQMGRGWRRWAPPKNPANISVTTWEGQLLALWEAGLPIAIDPETLETRGVTDFGGRIGPTFSAHPHRVGDSVFNFGIHYGRRFSIDLYTFAGRVRRLGSVPLGWPTTIHDFIATSRHLVFFCAPLRLRFARLLSGTGTFQENLVWEPERGTEVIVVPLAAPHAPIRFDAPPFFQWHFVNAWEKGNDTIVVDYLPYDDFKTNAWWARVPFETPAPAPASCYARARLDLAARRMDVERLSSVYWEFPAVHPDEAGHSHTSAWLLSFDPAGGRPHGLPPVLYRFSPATGASTPVPLAADHFPGEAVVVPRHDHAEGWVLSLVYDGRSDASYVAIIDGAHPEEGPVARVWFEHAIPLGFHGTWQAVPTADPRKDR